jgi:arsenite methyltransferase
VVGFGPIRFRYEDATEISGEAKMSETRTREEEMAVADQLPQADATSLVDGEQLERAVKEMYGHVAREESADLHFETGRGLAERLGYDSKRLDEVPADAVASFAGVGFHFDLAALRPGERVLDLGSGSGTDVFYAALAVGADGQVGGVDFTEEQVVKAQRLRDAHGFDQVELRQASIEELPFDASTFDCVVSNGVINLSLRKDRVFEEAARVLRPGGRLAISDIVSGKALRETTRRNTDLWAACVAGAIPRASYVGTIEAAGFEVRDVKPNPYEFVSDHALEACSTYEIESVSILAVRG